MYPTPCGFTSSHDVNSIGISTKADIRLHMLVEKGKVVEVRRLTVRCCEVVVDSTGVQFELSVGSRTCSEERDADSLYVLLRASAIRFFLPSICSMVMYSWLRLSCYLMIIWLVGRQDMKATSGWWSLRIVIGCPCHTPLKCLTELRIASNSFFMIL